MTAPVVKIYDNLDVSEVVEIDYAAIEKGVISVPIDSLNPVHLWNDKGLVSGANTMKEVTVGIKNSSGGNTAEFIQGTPYNNHQPIIECRSDDAVGCPDDAQSVFTPIGGDVYLNVGDLPANCNRSLHFRVNLPPDATTGIQGAKIVIGYSD